MNGLVVLKISGAALLVTAGLMVGKHLAENLFLRVKLLEEIRAAIERLATEIGYSASPLHEALLEVGNSCEAECKTFFHIVSTALKEGDGLPARVSWSSGVAYLANLQVLTAQDIESLNLLGPSLGTSGRDEQLRHLQSAVSRLSRQIEQARSQASRFEGFYREMGVLVATAIVLLLL